MSGETCLVAISAVCYRHDSRLDVPGVFELAHARGAPTTSAGGSSR